MKDDLPLPTKEAIVACEESIAFLENRLKLIDKEMDKLSIKYHKLKFALSEYDIGKKQVNEKIETYKNYIEVFKDSLKFRGDE